MANIPPGKVAEWVEKQIMPELTKGFNSFVNFTATQLPKESPQYTGFYASNWQASLTRPVPDEFLSPKGGGVGKEPWYGIGIRKRRGETVKPHVVARFDVPSFKLSDTVYIANRANYARYAVVGKAPFSTQYGGIMPFLGQLQGLSKNYFGASDIRITGAPSR